MTLIILGSILFLASHMIYAFGLRARVEAIGGQHAYIGLVTVLSVISLILIVMGFQQTSYQQVWIPLAASYALASYLVPIATILIVAENIPGNIGRHVKHPMLTGVAFWAFLHLLANGDLLSTIIFITFGGYSIYRRLTLQPQPSESKQIYLAGLAIALGLVVYGLFNYFDEAPSGVGLS